MSTRAPITRRDLMGGGCALAAAMLGLHGRRAWAMRRPRRAFRLVFFADVHARAEWDTPLALERAAAAINRRRPDLVIAGGDLITEGFECDATSVAHRWDVYHEFQRAIRSPVAPVVGNHDLVAARPVDGTPPAADPRHEFRTRLGIERTYRSFDAAGYHFILLDSVAVSDDELLYHGRIDDRQQAWLRADLETVEAGRPIIAATHIPLLTAFYQATEGGPAAAPANRVVVNNTEVLRLFDSHNLLLVLQGHLHVAETLRWRDTTFVTGGAVCGKWWRGPWHGTEEGFTTLTLRRDHVDWEYVDLGWDALRP